MNPASPRSLAGSPSRTVLFHRLRLPVAQALVDDGLDFAVGLGSQPSLLFAKPALLFTQLSLFLAEPALRFAHFSHPFAHHPSQRAKPALDVTKLPFKLREFILAHGASFLRIEFGNCRVQLSHF